jgi:hypothetical protein
MNLQKILFYIKTQLYFWDFLKSILVFLCVFFSSHYFGLSFYISLSISILSVILEIFINKRFQSKQIESEKIIHQKIKNTEYSTQLLSLKNHTIAQQLQLERLNEQVFKIPFVFQKNIGYFLLLFISVLSLNLIPKNDKKQNPSNQISSKNTNQNTINQAVKPVYKSATLAILPPAYTGLENRISSDLNASAITNSTLKWSVNFSHTNRLTLKLANTRGEEIPFGLSDGIFNHQDVLLQSGFYALKAYWKDSIIYQSEFYRLEAIPDAAPKIEPKSKELYQLHFLKDSKMLSISAKISDDFMVNQAFLVATVARGSGENVKFRELKIPISEQNFQSKNINQNIDLKKLNFTPGDELYYYWAAFDNRNPEPNFTKSDTYFVVYKDTSDVEEADLATMAMNILPEYFRSQRQIIIDTEKLIAKQGKLDKTEFNAASNELGFDQKALRLRYGQYLGEEEESSIKGAAAMPAEAEDVLKGFVHDHDGGEHEEEHALEKTEEHHHHDEGKSEKDPVAELLEEYTHSHDDGEVNTFYEQSTRVLLKSALEQMWQSELHLRLNEPEKALPFENKALEFLKEAQQKARTFVKKTSFDPPPIKEKEKRLTGELTKFNAAFSSIKKLTVGQLQTLLSESIGMLDLGKKTVQQKQKLILLGQILTENALNNQLEDWKTIGLLQKIINDKSLSTKELYLLKSKIISIMAFDETKQRGNRSASGNEALKNAFWRKMNQ